MHQPEAKAMPKPKHNANKHSQQTDTCRHCASHASDFCCTRCGLSTCTACRFRRWTICKACFWTKEATNLLSVGFPAQDLDKRMAAKIEFEERFWQAFLSVEGKPNAMTLAARIAGGRQERIPELCHLCEENQLQRPAIAQCARCRKLLCEHCIDDYPGCRCLACHVLALSTEADSRTRQHEAEASELSVLR